MQVEDALVDAHLPAVIRVGTLTTGRLAYKQLELLGRHAHGASNLEVLLKSLVLQVGADLLQSIDLAGGQGDADTVDRRITGLGSLKD